MCSEQFIHPPPIVLRLSPLGFHRYASEFFDVANSIKAQELFSPVPYYLHCHSLELILKAFLLTKNVPMDDLKSQKLGHNLTKILNRAKQEGLSDIVEITQVQNAEIRKANAYYNVPQKGFEYFKVTSAITKYRDLPDIEILAELTARLIAELEGPCLNAT